MKILALSQHYCEEKGGSAVYTRNLCRAMSAEGHSVYLVTEEDVKSSVGLDDWEKVDGYWIRCIPPRLPSYSASRSQLRTINAVVRRELDHWISSLGIDVVHVLQGFSLSQAVLPHLPPRTLGFWTIHNVPPQEYTFNLLAKLPVLNRIGKELYFALVKAVNGRIIRKLPYERLICNSNQTRNLALLAGALPEKAVVVPMGINSNHYAPAVERDQETTGGEEGFPLILTVAGVIPHKGQLDMIEGMKSIVAQYEGARYVNIGAIRDEVYYRQLVSRMEELGLQGRCRFPGHVSNSELLRLYHACDVYVQPSRQDGFNMSALQALSCGKQVVVTRAGAMPEYLEEIGGGRVVAPGLPEQLANAVIHLTRGGALVDSQEQHVKVAGTYDWSVIAKETLRIYQASRPPPAGS